MGANIITEILGALTDFLAGIGASIVAFFEELVIADPLTGELTTLAIWLLVFLGLALAIGIARLVFVIFRTRH